MVMVEAAKARSTSSPRDMEGTPNGYRQSELGWIPVDWDIVPLGALGEALIGLTYSPRDVRSGGTLVLRSSNVQNGRLRFEDNVFVEMSLPERVMVKTGDILICVRNGSRELIGKCALIDERADGMAFGAFMGIFRSELNDYLFPVLDSELIRRQVREHLGATINQITNKSLKSFLVPLPPTATERNGIAEALSNADALIEALEALIAKKRAIKQGAMQNLLTGKRRLPGFTGEWRQVRLGQVGEFSKGSGVRRGEASSGSLPCVRYGELYTSHNDIIREFRSWISPQIAATAQKVKGGVILFAGSGETKEEIGKCAALLGEVEAYAGGDIVVFRPSSDDATFLGYYLNTPAVQRQKASKSQGDAVVHISAAALASIELSLPSEREQAAIADVLTDMDNEIAVLEQKLTKVHEIKQGMMQELLTGRVRLV